MKILCQILSILLVIVAVSGCTAYVNADINANSGNSSSQSESSENVSSELSSDDLSSLWDDVQLEVEGNLTLKFCFILKTINKFQRFLVQ